MDTRAGTVECLVRVYLKWTVQGIQAVGQSVIREALGPARLGVLRGWRAHQKSDIAPSVAESLASIESNRRPNRPAI